MVVRKLWDSQIEAFRWEALDRCGDCMPARAGLKFYGQSSSLRPAHNLRTTMNAIRGNFGYREWRPFE
jgi:hypothetical protein